MSGPHPDGHRRADIQGLRAVAVVGVVAAHVAGWPGAGYLGVDVFFVISGFVITELLLRDRERTGRIRLRAFYARRARRILPLAFLVLGLTVLAAGWALSAPRAAETRGDAIWAALFAANWHFAQVGSDYFALGDAPSPVLHFWSLGVEEQFYLVWPWLVLAAAASVVGVARPRSVRPAVAVVCALVAAGSLAWEVVQGGADPTTAYYSSFTRAWELALGALLATVPAALVRLPPWSRALLSWGGLAVVAASFLVLGGASPPVPAAILPVLGTLAVLGAGIGGRAPTAVLLTNPVSRYLGDISYGVYLWHFPIVVLLPVVVPGSAGERLVVVLLTLVLASISYHLFERPVLDAPAWSGRRSAWREWWLTRRRGMLAAGTAAVCLVAGVLGTAVAAPRAFAALGAQSQGQEQGQEQGQGQGLPAESRAAPAVPVAPSSAAPVTPTSPDPTSSTTLAPSATTTAATPVPLGASGQALQDGLSAALAARAWPSDLTPTVDQWATTKDESTVMKPCVATVVSDSRSCTLGNQNGPEIDVYGDSLGIPLLAAVVAAYGKDYKIRGLTKLACAVNGVDANFGKDEWAVPCVDHRNAVVDYVKRVRPEVVMMVETYAWATKLKSTATGDAAAAEWAQADQALVDAIGGSAKHVVIVSPSIPGVAFLDCHRAGGSPGRCVTGIPSWWQETQDAERRVTGATFLDTLHWYCVDRRCPIFTTVHDTVLKGDYLHPSVQYMRLVASDLAYRFSAAGVVPAH